jgi:iron complex transport system ATP-binding protein
VTARLDISGVSFSYYNGRVIRDVSLRVGGGEMVGLLGPNGSGKTTLLKLAAGVLKPVAGGVMLDGADLAALGRKAVARSVAVVPQELHVPFAFTAAQIVMLGRTPFLRPFSEEGAADVKLVRETMGTVGVAALAERRYDELSGGEKQKVVLAMALAQRPRLLLLDEPTMHLDIAHQVGMLELVRKLNREQGLTVVAAMHDLNLAALYFDRLVLLNNGAVRADGRPAEVLTQDIISEVYQAPVRVEHHPLTGAPHVVIVPADYSKK